MFSKIKSKKKLGSSVFLETPKPSQIQVAFIFHHFKFLRLTLCSKVFAPYESLSALRQPAFKIWLGLLEPGSKALQSLEVHEPEQVDVGDSIYQEAF